MNVRYYNISFYFALFLIVISSSVITIQAQDSLIITQEEVHPISQIDNFRLSSADNRFAIHLNEKDSGIAQMNFNGTDVDLGFIEGRAFLQEGSLKEGLNFIRTSKNQKLFHISLDEYTQQAEIKEIPLWLSLIPPLVAIILALIFKEVIISLVIGIWSGAFIAFGMKFGSITAILGSFFAVFDHYILESLNDSGHLSVIIFSLLIGAMVALISKNGGMMGVVKALSKYAKSAKSTQFITWLLGVAIFFDDYANTLIVGNTMRAATDKFRISREKLAYIVDSTAAPVSAVAFITTWIGAELGYIGDGIAKIEQYSDLTPYSVFLQSLKYSFYPILTLIFILIIIKTGKDYGPMWKAENRARTTGRVSPAKSESDDEPDMEDLSPVKGAPLRWINAVLPIITVIFITILGLLITGFTSTHGAIQDTLGQAIPNTWGSIWANMDQVIQSESPGLFAKLGQLIGASDSYSALLWASSSGLLVALMLTLTGRIMKLHDAMHWAVIGIKTMLPAIIILTLAWALAITTDQLHTADYISNALQGNLNPYLLPAVIFVMAAFIAFSTGSSWSTMAILYPIAIPTSFAITSAAGLPPDVSFEILLCVISTVLSASVLGDHVSPISDTTILSSLASDCNHLDHVRTQIPYALTVGIVSILAMSISIFLGGGFLICLIMMIISVIGLYFAVHLMGKSVPETYE